MLDAHPDVAVTPETFFMRRFWERRDEYGDLEDEEHFEALLADIVDQPEFEETGIDPASYREAAWQGARTYAALFQRLLRQYADQHEARVVGEKTPNHVLYMPALQQFFPEARFVHVVRDPRAVVNSWRSVPWSSGRVWRDAEVWSEYVRTARRDASEVGDALHTLHYEELVRTPEYVLQVLCRFLNLSYTDEMLAFHEQEPDNVNVEREPWKEAATQPVDPDGADRWREELSSRLIALIEAKAWPEMTEWGYLRETPWERLAPALLSTTIRKAGWKLQLVMDQMSERG